MNLPKDLNMTTCLQNHNVLALLAELIGQISCFKVKVIPRLFLKLSTLTNCLIDLAGTTKFPCFACLSGLSLEMFYRWMFITLTISFSGKEEATPHRAEGKRREGERKARTS